MSAPGILQEVTYFANVSGQNRLLYNEIAAKVLNELTRPAYRLAVARGEWPAAGRNATEQQLQIVKDVCILAEACKQGEYARSSEIPALSLEEVMCAKIMLGLLDYCGGRSIDIGRAVMLTHMHKANKPRSNKA